MISTATVPAALPSDDDLLQAFRLIDARLAAGGEPGVLPAFRDRLGGELYGDGDRVSATLAPGFTLVTHAVGATTVSRREEVVESIRRQEQTGVVMWIELEDLVVDDRALAGHGLLHTLLTPAAAAARWQHDLGPQELLRTTLPLALFLRFEDALMTTEILYLDPAATQVTTLSGAAMPPREHLRALVDRPGDRR